MNACVALERRPGLVRGASPSVDRLAQKDQFPGPGRGSAASYPASAAPTRGCQHRRRGRSSRRLRPSVRTGWRPGGRRVVSAPRCGRLRGRESGRPVRGDHRRAQGVRQEEPIIVASVKVPSEPNGAPGSSGTAPTVAVDVICAACSNIALHPPTCGRIVAAAATSPSVTTVVLKRSVKATDQTPSSTVIITKPRKTRIERL
jgi:hypothetical protein